jgi:hypothetical protein
MSDHVNSRDEYLRFLKDEFDWEPDPSHSPQWWDMLKSWFEYPVDELDLFTFPEEPATDEAGDLDATQAICLSQ